MPITGTDEISLKILKAFKQGIKLKDIPSKYSVSMDQAKRLSRYYKMLEKSREHLDSQIFEKIQRIGLKVLYLSPLFKEDDWEGLTEILSLSARRLHLICVAGVSPTIQVEMGLPSANRLNSYLFCIIFLFISEQTFDKIFV